jgi:hypothetical protein
MGETQGDLYVTFGEALQTQSLLKLILQMAPHRES